MAKDAARSFSATIEKGDRGGAFVTIPFDVEKELGAKRVRVVATIDDVEYSGSLVRMGSSDWMLGVLKEIRERIGKAPGDTVAVTVRKDTDPRVAKAIEMIREGKSR